MKKIYLTFLRKIFVTFLVLSVFSATTFAGSGIFETYIIVQANGGSANYYDLFATTGNPDFQGTNFGAFSCTNTLVIKGGQNKTYKNGTDNILNGYVYYKVYKNGTDPNTVNFTSINLGFDINLNGSGDQQWTSTGGAANILQGLANGTYTIEAYSSADFTYSGGSGTHYQNLSGANYKATFTISNPIVISSPAAAAPVSVCYGSSTTLSATATGADYFEWQEEITTGNWGTISGAIGSVALTGGTVSTTISNVIAAKNVRCRFTNCAGINESISSTFTVTPTRPTISVQPASQSDCETNDIIFNVTATGVGSLTYQWQKKLPGGSFVSVAGDANITVSGVSGIKVDAIGNAANPHLTEYRCIISDGNSCTVTSDAAVMTVNSVGVPGAQTVCVGENVTFSVPIVGDAISYAWQKSSTIAGFNGSTPSIGTSSILTINNVSATDASNYRLRVTFNITTPNDNGSNVCTRPGASASSATVSKLTVNTLPTAPSITNAARCGSGTITLSASGATAGQNYKWYADNSTTTPFQTNLATYTATLSTTTDYYVSVYNTTTLCESARVKVTATINEIPTITLGGVPDICNNLSTFDLPFSATTGSPNEYTISAGSPSLIGFSTITNATLGSSPIIVPIPANSLANTYQFIITVRNTTTSCVAVAQNFTAKILQVTQINTHPVSQIICETNPVTFSVAAIGDNLSYQWKKGSTNVGTNSNTFNISSVATTDAGNYTCVVTGTCLSLTSNAATLTVNLLTNITTPPQAQTVCAGTTNISFSVVAVGTNLSYQWKKGSTNIGTNSSTYTIPIVSLGDAGSYSCIVTGECNVQTSSAAALIVNATPAAPTAVSPINYCQNASTIALSATASGTNTLLWYGINSTGGSSSASSPTPSSTRVVTVNYYVSQKSLENCESSRAEILVITNENPLSPLTSPTLNYCKNTTASALSATTAGSNTLIWYDENDVVLASAPTPNTGTVGTQIFKVSQISPSPANCESPKAIITVTINDLPAAPTVTTPIGYCQNATASQLSATATGGNALLWYGTNPTGGTSSGTAPTPPTSIGGTFSYFVSQKDGNNCESPRAKIDVIVTPSLSGSVSGTNAFCITGVLNNSTTLTANPTGGNGIYTYQWKNLTGNIASETSQTLVTSTANTYKTIITSGYCTATTTNLIVTSQGWNDVPSVTGNTPDICGSGTKTLRIVSPSGAGSYKWFVDGTTLSQTASGISFTTPTLSSTTSYFVAREQQITANLTCQTARTQVTINVNSAASAPTITGNLIICSGETTTLTASGCGGTVVWSNNTSGITLTISASGTYTATCYVNGCASPASVTQTLVVNAKPSAPIITGNLSFCTGGNTTLTANGCAGIIIWNTTETGSSISVMSAGTYNATCTENGCVSLVSATKTIVVNPIPSAPTITSDDADNIVCVGTNISLTANGCAGSVLWSNNTSGTTLSVSVSGTYAATCTVNGCASLASVPQNIVVNPFPSFAINPSNQTNCKATSSTFSASVSASATLQWEYRTSSAGTFANVGTSTVGTSHSFSATNIGSATYPHGSEFRLKAISNGCETLSTIAFLSVNSINGDFLDQIKCNGSSTTFDLAELTISGTVSTYQWEVSSSASSGFGNVVGSQFSGANSSILTINPITAIDGIKYYRCKIVFTNTASGACTISSNSGKLTVTTIVPPTISGATTICQGQSTNLSASGCGGTITWSTGASGSILNTSLSGTYAATCTQNSCTSLASNVHTLTLNPIPNAPTITSDDADNIVCQGTSISLTASGCAGSILWSNNTSGIILSVSASGTYAATCTVNNCVSLASLTQTIVVNPIPNAPTISGGTSICSGNATTLTASACAGTITWNTGVTGSTLSVSALGTYNATCTVNNCVSLSSATQAITVNPIPNAPTIAGNATICQGTSTSLTANSCAGTITWSTGTTGNSVSVSAGTYSATCTENSCTSQSSAIYTISENPLPTITLSTVNSICNAATTFDLPYSATTNSPDKYSLSSAMPNFVSLTDINLPVSPISLTIPSGKIGTHTFTLIIKNSTTGCLNSQIFSVTVLPVLVGGSIELSPSTTNCAGYNAGSISSVALASGGKIAYIYQWQSSTDNINFTDISGENAVSFDPAALNVTTYFRRKVTDACNSEAFSSNTHQITIVPDPQILLTDATEKVICSGNSISLSATISGGFGTCTPSWESADTPSGTYTSEQVGGLSFTKTLSNATVSPIFKYFKVVYACSGTGSGSCNQSTSAIVKVTVNPLPTGPTVSGGGTICSSQSTNLTATGCNGNLLWSNNLTATSISVSVAGTYTATCVNSCGTSAASNAIVVSVTLINQPTLAGATTVCDGQSATLTATNCAGIITWNNGLTGTSISVNPSITTSYTATCTANNCSSMASEGVTITVAPSVDFSIGTVADLCNSATTFSLPYTATLGVPDKYSLTSTMPNFVPITDVNLPVSPISVIIPANQTGTFNFSLIQKISATGCSKTQTFSVTVLPVLVGGSIELSPSTTNCAGYNAGSISSLSLASGGNTAYIYQWQSSTDNINFTDISGENAVSFDPAALNVTTYFRRKVTDACNSEAFSSNTHQITIVPDPQILLTDATEKVICSGNSISLSATISGGFGTCTPSWESADTPSGTYTSEQVGGLSFTKTLSNATVSPIFKYFKVVYACSGTGSGSCNQSTSAIIKVTINFIPNSPIITPASVVICPTQSTLLTASGCSGLVIWVGGQTGSTLSVSAAGSYSATCSINNCVSTLSSNAIVTVASGGTPVPAPTISGTTTICNGQSTSLTATGCIGLVTWSNSSTGSIISVNPSLSTDYTATCFDGTCTSNASNQISVTINDYPIILTHPKNEADCDGNSVTFSVSASPTTGFQWQRKIPNGSFIDISGAITNSLTISSVGSVTDPNLTEYKVIVSNSTCSVLSNVAVLTVNSVTGSLADKSICEGTNTTFDLTTISTTGTIQSYQWQSRVGTSGTWIDIAGATTTTLTINNATNADEQYYRCKFNFIVGSSTCARYTTEDDTNGAKLTVLVAAMPTISGNNVICSGISTTLTANNCDGTILWSSGQTTLTITVSPSVNTSYSVTCASTQCNFSGTSVPYSVTVNSVSFPTNLTFDVISTQTLVFSARATVPNGTILWYTKATGGVGTSTAPFFTALGTYTFWVTQTDPLTGCESPRLIVIAKVLDFFHITSQPPSQVDCKGNSVYMAVGVAAPTTAITYQWQRKRPNEADFVNLVEDANGIKGWYARTMVVSNVGDVDNPHLSQYRCMVSYGGQNLFSNPSTLTVNSVIGLLPNVGVCVGGNTSFNLPNYFNITGNVLSYQWQTRPGTSGTWTNLTDGNGISGSNSNDLKFTNVTYDKGVYYRCSIKFNTQGFECTESTDAAQLIVSGFPPKPAVTNVFYCQFANAAKLKVDSPIQNLSWYSEATGGIASNTAPTPSTAISGTYYYYVADRTDQGCESPRAEIRVEIGATPPAPLNTTPISVNEGTILIFSADGTPKEGQVLRWFTTPTITTFTTIAPGFSTVGTFTRYVAQLSDHGCIGPRTAITASIIQKVVVQVLRFTKQPISQADCDGNSVTFNVTASASSAISYQWQSQKPTETSFSNIANETANSLKISNIGDGINPNLSKYRCIIKDEKGSITSEEAILTVNQIIGTLSNINLCEGDATKLNFNSLTLTGKVVSYVWQKKEGSTYSNILTDKEGIANVSESATYRGRIGFFIDEKNVCFRNTDDLKVDVKPVPTVPQVTNQAICQNVAFNLEKSVTAANTVLWYDSFSSTTGSKTIPKVDVNKVGKTTFFVSQISTFGCESVRKSFDLTISAIPIKPLVSDLNLCRTSPTIALTATTDKENTLLWYASNTAKDAINIPISDTKTDGTTSYFVSAKSPANCESSRSEIKVNVAQCIATFEANFNNCLQISTEAVKGNQWFDIYDNAGKLYASVNPNGLDLGKVSISIKHYGRGSGAIPATKNDTKFMARYIDFQSAFLKNFEKPVSLRIYYQNTELSDYKTATSLPNLTINDFNIVHYDGKNEDCGFENNDNFAEGNSIVIYKNVVGNQVAKDFFYLQFDVNDFSENGATANDFTEISFSGKETDDKMVKLNWETKFEIKAEKFILERSADCKTWVSLGEIKANGTSSNYERLDSQPLSGNSCYRLVYIDKDGTKKYLDPIEVNFTDTTPTCTIFPNPWTTGDVVKLYTRNIKEKEIKLYDMLGQEYSFNWKKDEFGIIKIRPDVYLNKGTHFIVVIGEDGSRCIQKIVINP